MRRSRAASTLRIAILGIIALATAVVSAGAQETVTISVPLAVSFPVTDVSRSTSGAPNVTRISFSNANLSFGHELRVSVQSDAALFTPPSGSSMPASNVSWNSLVASGGIGRSGTLSSSSFAVVFEGDP